MSQWTGRGGRLQHALFRLAAWLLRPRRHDVDLARARIALLRFDRRLGEVLLQTPLFGALRESLPRATLVAVTHPGLASLLLGQPDVDEVLPFGLRGFPFTLSSWRSLWRLGRARIDVAIDCSNYTLLSTSHALATLLTRAPWRVGFARGTGASACFSQAVTPIAQEASERRQRLQLLMALGIDGADRPMSFVPRAAVGPELSALLHDVAAQPGRWAVLNPGGRLDWRRVPIELFVGAAQVLLEHGRQPVVVWGPGERELATSICMSARGRARLAPPTSVHELAALLEAAGCTVTNNSGPMHLSIAVGAPTLALFKNMPVARWGETAAPHAVVDVSDEDRAHEILLTALDGFLGRLESR
ncbi:MAG: glycosyltransferase family 9 protein [Pseudomonadota bacterium]